MTLGNRIKKVRQALDLTQTEFAAKIGTVQNTITRYETNNRNPSASVITLICEKFNVREEWLRTGEGEMFKPKPSDVLDQLAFEYKLSNAAYVMIEKFIRLRPEIQNGMVDYFREVNAALEEVDPTVLAYTGNEPPRPMDGFIKKHYQNMADTPEELEKKFPPVDSEQTQTDVG